MPTHRRRRRRPGILRTIRNRSSRRWPPAFGRVDAFHLGLVLGVEPIRAEAALRAGVRSADVEHAHLHARRLRHRRPDVARVRNLGQQLLREVGAHRRRRGVDNRRVAGHGDGFLQRGDLHLHVDGERLVDHDAHVLPLHLLEAGEIEVDLIDARRQRQESVRTISAGHLHLRLNEGRPACRHGDAGQHCAGVIGHGAVDAAPEFLCPRVCAAHHERDEHGARHHQVPQLHRLSSGLGRPPSRSRASAGQGRALAGPDGSANAVPEV